MKERRQFARLSIPLPVRLETMASDKKEVLDLETRDISYTGTFITTLTLFPKGTRFILDFTIPTDNLKKFKDLASLKACTGSMVRSAPHGLAIQFDKECRIKGLKAL
jgi:PilZ domain